MNDSKATDLLNKAEQIIEKMEDLLVKSEERIGKTNEMVHELSSVVAGLNKAYIHHIDQMSETNHLITTQNIELIKQIENVEADIRHERDRYDKLLANICNMIKPSVNINQ